jgi:hypothetical protein
MTHNKVPNANMANGGGGGAGVGGLISTDNEDEDYPPQFTTLANELEKCKSLFLSLCQWSH